MISIPSSIQARDLGVALSRKARFLLSARAMNDLVREAIIHGGEEWIATWLPRRFQRSYASLLGYVTSQRKSKVYKEASDSGLTYDEKKRKLQGHGDPLVWTGRLRAQAFANARATATAVRGEARGRITFGRLAVGGPGGYRAPPPIVVSTLLGGPARRLPGQEVQTVRDGFIAYAVAALDGVEAKQSKPLPAPSVIVDRRIQRLGEHRWQEAESRRAQDAIRERGRERRARTAERHARWRQDAGGSSPIGVEAMTPAEAKLRHRGQARESYRRRARFINARRRLRRRGSI
jgi:hypothetical protein